MQRYAGKVVSKLFFFQFFLLFLSEFIYFWYYSEARLHVLASIHEHNENIFIIIISLTGSLRHTRNLDLHLKGKSTV